MSGRAGTTLAVVVGGAAIGSYLMVVNCPDGWWASAGLGSGGARLGSGALVGSIVGAIIRFFTVPRMGAQDRCRDPA